MLKPRDLRQRGGGKVQTWIAGLLEQEQEQEQEQQEQEQVQVSRSKHK